jgi:hypothetical protein
MASTMIGDRRTGLARAGQRIMEHTLAGEIILDEPGRDPRVGRVAHSAMSDQRGMLLARDERIPPPLFSAGRPPFLHQKARSEPAERILENSLSPTASASRLTTGVTRLGTPASEFTAAVTASGMPRPDLMPVMKRSFAPISKRMALAARTAVPAAKLATESKNGPGAGDPPQAAAQARALGRRRLIEPASSAAFSNDSTGPTPRSYRRLDNDLSPRPVIVSPLPADGGVSQAAPPAIDVSGFRTPAREASVVGLGGTTARELTERVYALLVERIQREKRMRGR